MSAQHNQGSVEGTMPGLMQDWPLTIDKIIRHAEARNPHARVVTRGTDLKIRQGSYADIAHESRRISRALVAHGLGLSDAIATLAWSTDHHLSLWYGIPAIGAVLHPLNPRFSPEQLIWIINHSNDKILFFDATFLPLVQAIQPAIPGVRVFVILENEADMPANSIGAISLEAFLASGDGFEDPVWGDFPENTASGLFYTSGTTGNPKGVLYSHRSTMLHALLAMPGYRLTHTDVVLPVVPMFHANCWGLAHIPLMVGASMVLPGPELGGRPLVELIQSEGVTLAIGVPSMWTSLYAHLKETGATIPTLKRLMTGGSPVPRSMIRMFKNDFDIDVINVWGMTETHPSASMNDLLHEDVTDPDEWVSLRARTGRMMFGIEAAIKAEDGSYVPADGETAGRLLVRGPCVVASYFRSDANILDDEGYFDTGDIAVMHPDKVLQITDRAKDVIKSGGEWISSVEMEDAVTLHPDADECAVIAIPHPKWEERPLVVIKARPEATLTADAIREFLSGKLPKWWLPEEIEFVDDLPLGATGKVDKKQLRSLFADRYGRVGG